MKLIEIFKFSNPGEIIRTVNGPVKYNDWLQLREREFRKAGRTVKIVRQGNRIALFANDVVGIESSCRTMNIEDNPYD